MFLRKRISKLILSPNTRNFANVFKLLNYNLESVSKEDKEKIVNLLNEAKTEEEISKYLSKIRSVKLMEYKAKHGNLTEIEQLLDIRGIEMSHLERICKSILKGKNIKSDETKEEAKLVRRTIPSLKQILLPEKIEDICAFKFDLNGLNFVHLKQNKIEKWQNYEENLVSIKAFEHHKLVEKTKEMVDILPKSQFFVYEELPRIMQKDPLQKMKMQMFILEASLIATLRCKNPQTPILSQKYSVINSVFKVGIRQERIKISQNIEELVENWNVDITEEHKNVMSDLDMMQKESLCATLLLGLSFRQTLQDFQALQQ